MVFCPCIAVWNHSEQLHGWFGHHCCAAPRITAQALEKRAPTQVGRLLYRSKQRGFLEMDLLVGLWAERNLPAMDARQLSAFEVIHLSRRSPL